MPVQTRRNTTNLHEAENALLELLRYVPLPELCARLGSTPAMLKRWASRDIPGGRCAEVIGLWHEHRRGLVA
jgi:hypothetical protein